MTGEWSVRRCVATNAKRMGVRSTPDQGGEGGREAGRIILPRPEESEELT